MKKKWVTIVSPKKVQMKCLKRWVIFFRRCLDTRLAKPFKLKETGKTDLGREFKSLPDKRMAERRYWLTFTLVSWTEKRQASKKSKKKK